MSDNVFIAINGDALHAKSKVYISRALARKALNDLDEYQLWASLALELLGKAALAQKHPSLVVDPNHSASLFVAAGIHALTCPFCIQIIRLADFAFDGVAHANTPWYRISGHLECPGLRRPRVHIEADCTDECVWSAGH